jgi:hypothetical protein
MPIINTTTGAVEVPRGTRSHINTSAILEPPLMTYEGEEPEILAVLPGGSWYAVIGGEGIPLIAMVALDDASMYGVVIGENGRIDLTDSVEQHPHFTGYKQANNR